MTDILEAIDRALGCQQCRKPLGDSPSDMYCSQDCSEAAADETVVEELGYGKAVLDWSQEDAPEGPFSWLPTPTLAPWRLPRSTSDLDDDFARWEYARSRATTKWQRDACQERWEELQRRKARRVDEELAETVAARGYGLAPWGSPITVRTLGEADWAEYVQAAFGFDVERSAVPVSLMPFRAVFDFEGLLLTDEEREEFGRNGTAFDLSLGGLVSFIVRRPPALENLGVWKITGITRDQHTVTYVGERTCAPG